MSSSASLEDARVSDQLAGEFASLHPFQKTFKLWFTYNGKPYSTVFSVERTSAHLLVRNECVKMEFVDHESAGLNPYKGGIWTNSPEKACFEPLLVSSNRFAASSSRISSVDVLQTLKTKIAILFPTFKTHRLCITDVAEKDGVHLSPFRILRGEDAIYEKYGYRSPFLTEFKDYVRGLTWGDIKMTPVAGNINAVLTFVNETEGAARLPIGEAIPDATSIVQLLREVTFEYEVAYKKKYPARDFSYDTLHVIGSEYIKKRNLEAAAVGRPIIPEEYLVVETVGEDNAWLFCFDPESDAWRRSKDALLFAYVEFATNSAASSRKTRRKHRRRRL